VSGKAPVATGSGSQVFWCGDIRVPHTIYV